LGLNVHMLRSSTIRYGVFNVQYKADVSTTRNKQKN